jgi:hypothetical protein
METKRKIALSYIPANFLLPPNLLRWGVKALKTAVANDNFDDDPPPSASAPLTIPSERETERDADLPRPLLGGLGGKPESNEREASKRRPPSALELARLAKPKSHGVTPHYTDITVYSAALC